MATESRPAIVVFRDARMIICTCGKEFTERTMAANWKQLAKHEAFVHPFPGPPRGDDR